MRAKRPCNARKETYSSSSVNGPTNTEIAGMRQWKARWSGTCSLLSASSRDTRDVVLFWPNKRRFQRRFHQMLTPNDLFDSGTRCVGSSSAWVKQRIDKITPNPLNPLKSKYPTWGEWVIKMILSERVVGLVDCKFENAWWRERERERTIF